MRVLASLTYYYPHWTGLTAYAQRLSEGLVRRGHQVTVLTSRYSKKLPPEEPHNGVRIFRLPTATRLSRGVIMPGFPMAAWRLVKEHDVVQIHTPMMESWLLTALAHRAGKKTLITHHGDLVMPAGIFNGLVERTVTFMMMQAERGAARISVHSGDYAANSKFLGPFRDKHAYIYPPAEIPRPDLQAAKEWRRELGIDDCYVVGFAGRFVEEKGFDFLLKAIPLVRQQIPNVKFVYAGEKNVMYEGFYNRWSHLVDQNSDHLVFLGLILDPQRLAQFYAMCDVFALPSRTDCFPSVQLEALLCGTPLVTTDIPGAREVVQVTGMGRLVRPQDPQALAEGLVEVLRERGRFIKPYETIRSVFNTERSLDEYEALLGTLI